MSISRILVCSTYQVLKQSYWFPQVPRVVTLSKDSTHRHYIPIELAGWLFGQFIARKKVYLILRPCLRTFCHGTPTQCLSHNLFCIICAFCAAFSGPVWPVLAAAPPLVFQAGGQHCPPWSLLEITMYYNDDVLKLFCGRGCVSNFLKHVK